MNSTVKHHVELVRAILACISPEDRESVLAELARPYVEAARVIPPAYSDARVDKK